MSTTRKTPKLRFPEFTDDWEQRKFSDVVEIGSGKDYKNLGLGDIPVYGTGGYMLSVDQSLSKDRDAIGIGRKGTIDKPFIIRAPFWTVDTLFYCIPKNKQNLQFTYCLFQNVDWKTYDESTGVPSLSKSTINNVTTKLPNLEEQQKIGELFNKLDTTITLHQRELDSLKKLKKSLLQKMFPKNGEKIPELRFPEFTGDWEQRKLKEIACKVKNKNKENAISETFTNSAEFGIISQKEFFDHEVASKTNLDSYYIVDIDDFVYNPRISVTAPVGPINRNKLGKAGVMSPLYTVFKTQGVSIDFLEHYFKSTNWHSYMYLNGDSGARSDRFSIKDDVFFDMPIMVPCIKEQMQIGLLFNAISKNITLHQRELDTLKKLKKGLLQNMFV